MRRGLVPHQIVCSGKPISMIMINLPLFVMMLIFVYGIKNTQMLAIAMIASICVPEKEWDS